MNKFNDFIFALGIIVGAVILLLLIKTCFVWAVWDFVVVPAWGAKALTFAQAASLTLFVNVLTSNFSLGFGNDKKD